MAFLHGIKIDENQGGTRVIQTSSPSVIGLVGTAIKGEIDTPIMISSLAEAREIFGKPYYKDIEGVSSLSLVKTLNDPSDYTIPQALDAIFKQAAATVVVVNINPNSEIPTKEMLTLETAGGGNPFYTMLNSNCVPGTLEILDADNKPIDTKVPENFDFTGKTIDFLGASPSEIMVSYLDASFHKVSAPFTLATLTNFTMPVEGEIVEGSLKVCKGNRKFSEGTDYVINPDSHIVPLDGGRLALVDTINVSYRYTDTAATNGIASVDRYSKGIEKLTMAESYGCPLPKILIAPNVTYDKVEVKTIADTLSTVAETLRAIGIVDLPASDGIDSVQNTEATNLANDMGDSRLYMISPFVRIYNSTHKEGVIQPASSFVAGVIAKSDRERGFWWSPSNRKINGITGVSRPISFNLEDAESSANTLNEGNVATIVYQDGYRLWGNHSSSSDPKWKFISVRRTADMINEALLNAHLWAVDKNITANYLEEVTGSVNNYLRSLQSKGAIIGGTCWADPELNTVKDIKDGKVTIDFDFTAPFPAEQISFSSNMVDGYLKEIFK